MTGYGFVISGQGTFLAHPVREFVVNRTIFDITGGDQALNTAAQEALDGAGRFVETRDPITGETTWYFFEPIGSTGWAVGIVLNIAQFLPDEAQTVRDQMNILLAGVAAIFSGVHHHLSPRPLPLHQFLGRHSGLHRALRDLIGLAWALTGQLEDDEGVLITSQSQLDRYLQGIEPPVGVQRRGRHGCHADPHRTAGPGAGLPRSHVSHGQRAGVAALSAGSNVTRGFALPQRIGEEATIEEMRREVVDDAEVILWAIGVTLRQTYDTSRFPFDQRTIVVRLAPADMTSPVLLTPDLDGYEILTPRALPGVD